MKRSLLVPHLLAMCFVALLPSAIFSADISATWLNGIGNWTDATQWNTNPNYPNNASGVTYDAIINTGNVTLDQNITIEQLLLNGGKLDGSFDLTLNQGLAWTGGEISGPSRSVINFAAGSSSTIAPPGSGPVIDSTLTGRTINNSGIVNQSKAIIGTDGIINNLVGATWNAQSGAALGTVSGSSTSSGPTFNNAGIFVVSDAVEVGGPFNNDASVTIQSNNSLQLSGGGNASGVFNVGGALSFANFSSSISNQPYTLLGGIITGAGTTRNGENNTLIIAGNCSIATNFTNAGLMIVQSGATLSFTGSFTTVGQFGAFGI